MSSSSKFKLEVKATEPRVANFMSGTSENQIAIQPEYHSNIEYGLFGTKTVTPTSYGMNETYVAIAGSNDSIKTVATFNQSNINFNQDMLVRGNLVVDGFITTLNLDLALSPDDLFSSAGIQNTFIDVASNTVLAKYMELTDSKLQYTSNTITSLVASKYSNLEFIGNSILNTNAGFMSYYSLANVYDASKFEARLQTKTADNIANGISRKYIVNGKYNQNQLTIEGDLWTQKLQTAGNTIVQNDVNASIYYADGYNLTNLNAGDGTTNSVIEGSKLFYNPSYISHIVNASNMHASNYITTFYNQDLQIRIANILGDTSNYISANSSVISEILASGISHVSNYAVTDLLAIEEPIQQSHLQNMDYLQANDLLSSNYIQTIYPIYTNIQNLSNLIIDIVNIRTADASNFISDTSNLLYTELQTANDQIQHDIAVNTNNLLEIMLYTYNNLSNMILGADAYSNVLHSNLAVNYDVYMPDYLTTSSNTLRQTIDSAKNMLIANIDTKANTIGNKISFDTSAHNASITGILNDLETMIDVNSLASSNHTDTVKMQVLDYLSQKIGHLVMHINNTSNMMNNSSNEMRAYMEDSLQSAQQYNMQTSNELVTILEQNINYLLGNAYNVLNQTNTDITAKLNSLTTDIIPEGTSNVYYTEARFDEKFATLTFDNFKQGSTNKFIVNNAYHGNFRVLGTIYASNMVIDGDLSTINTDIYQTGSATIISSNDINLNVGHFNNEHVLSLSNMDVPIMIVSNTGDIAVNKASASIGMDVAGVLKAPYFDGNANNVTNINLTDKSTNFLAEGINKYFDTNRVSYLIDASNIQASNYITDTSNIIFNNLAVIRDQSNYIFSESNIFISNMSNLYLNVKDYHDSSSNSIINMMMISSVNFSNYIVSTSNNLMQYSSNLLVNSSNYVASACNLLLNQLAVLEFHQSNYITSANTIMSNLVVVSSLDASNYVLRSSNMLVSQMQTGLETSQSNYVIRSCNMLFDQIRRINYHLGIYTTNSSNNIMRPVNASNIGVSNYILRTSNELMTYVNNSLGSVSATANRYSITDVYTADKIMHFNFNNIKIVNNADDNNFQLLNRTTITPVYPNITTGSPAVSTANNFFAQYETTNRFALASSNNIYVFNNDDNDMRTILNMMNTAGFLIHFVFRAQFVQNTPIFFIGNQMLSMFNIKLLYGNLHITIGSFYNFITILVLTPIVPFVWYVVDVFTSIQNGSMTVKVYFNKILQNIILRSNTTSTVTPLLLQTVAYNNILQYDGTISYSAIDGSISTSITPVLISGNDYCFFFTGNNVSYTVSVQANTVCDILMIGGGGSGSAGHGGGGGAGGMVFIKSVTLPVGTYTFTVGGGGVSETGSKGANTKITLNGTDILVAEGGGAGGGGNPGGNGGSGGGGDGWTSGGSGGLADAGLANNIGIPSYNGTTGVRYGNNGGSANASGGAGGGGGGAGTAGIAGNAATNNSYGGDGRKDAVIGGVTYDFVSVFGNPILNYGVNNDNNNTRYFAGGGGGGRVQNNGGKGGGGSGGKYDGVGPVETGGNNGISAGLANTGSGGGGGGDYGNYPGAAGGSGIIILRATINQLPVTKSVSVAPLRMLLGCSNLTDTYEDNFGYIQGFTYTNTYFSSNSYITNTLAPIMRSSAYNYNSFSNLIFSSYFASNFDYQYSSNISSLNSAIIGSPANATFFQNFHDNADATRLTIGDRTIDNLNFVFTEVETNLRLQTGYYYFMLDLQNEVTADLLIGEQSDTSIDNYLNVANYYNSNFLNAPSATITHTSNQVLTYPLYMPEGYYRMYLRMLRTIANRNSKYFIPQFYYTNTWSSPSYSLNNSNAFTYISYNTLNSTYQTGRTLNINDRFMVNNNATGASSNLYVYRYFQPAFLGMGYNNYGQLGIGNTTDNNTGVASVVLNTTGTAGSKLSATNITGLYCSENVTIFKKSDNSLLGVGDKTILGFGRGANPYWIGVPTALSITNVSQVACGNGHALFLKTDNTVFSIGYNPYGQLGTGVSSYQSWETSFVQVKINSTTPMTGIVFVAAGLESSYFIKNIDGVLTNTVYACGQNNYGQLGNNTTLDTFRGTTYQYPDFILNSTGTAGTKISGIVHISSSASTFLTSNSGHVFACGRNDYWQLGINNTSYMDKVSVPTLVPITDVTKTSAGTYHSLFLTKDKTVYSVGYNYYGELGIGMTSPNPYYVKTLQQVKDINGVNGNAMTDIIDISAGSFGGRSSLFLHASNILYGCGEQAYNFFGSDTIGLLSVPSLTAIKSNGSIIQGVTLIPDRYRYNIVFNAKLPNVVNVSNYNFSISHSNLITPNTFFAGNRYSSSNLLNIQDFKIFNNPIVMASDYSINNILYNGRDKENVATINKIKANKWQEPTNYTSLTNQFIYYDEGNIGIGNTVPTTASLDINTSILTTYNLQTLNSVKTNRSLWTNLGVITSSDERIKTNLKDIDDFLALNQILKIEPKQYNYIDKTTKANNSNVYGFIAQQVRDVIPNAVTLHSQVIPNIYTIGAINNNNITFSKASVPDLQNAKKLMFIAEDGQQYTENILNILRSDDTISISIENTYPYSNVFVYGTYIDDFHTIDKSYIYTLNVCALQDLHKQYTNMRSDLDKFKHLSSNFSNMDNIDNFNDLANIPVSDTDEINQKYEQLKTNINYLKHANDLLMQNIENMTSQEEQSKQVLEDIRHQNEILTSNQAEILAEQKDLLNTISAYTQEVFTIKSIMQLNNIS